MATRIRPELKEELARYGADRVDLCFNCGNCTAVCPLSRDDTLFPRALVRHVQLGLADRLAAAAEPWLCYACGECTTTCPRDATPGETMAALRRYAVARYDVTGISGLMTRSPLFALAFTILLGLLLGAFHLSIRHARHGEPAHWSVFSWIPYETIHTIGVLVGVAMVALAAASVFNAARLMLRPHGGFASLRALRPADLLRATRALAREIATLRRRAECADGARESARHPGFRLAHQAMLWGFALLLAATSLDFLLVFLLKIESYAIARPLGILGGSLMLYGLGAVVWQRVEGEEPHARRTTFHDAWLLVFLVILNLTGFALLLVTTFKIPGAATDAILLLHSVMAMELVLLFALTKIGHALFRPMALLFHFLRNPAAR